MGSLVAMNQQNPDGQYSCDEITDVSSGWHLGCYTCVQLHKPGGGKK